MGTHKKSVLVFTTCGISLPHLAIELEILEKFLNNFNSKFLLHCSGQLPSCYLNSVHNLFGCTLCKTRTQKFIEDRFNWNESIKLNRYQNITPLDFKLIQNINDLMEIEYKGIDIGRGISSSLISRTRNSKLIPYQYQSIISMMFSQAMTTIDQVELIIKNKSITDIILFNGRFYETYPIMSLAKKYELNYYTHEKGSNFKKYQFIKNSTVHSIAFREQQIEETWQKFKGKSIQVAEKWFNQKLNGMIKTEKNFTKDQKSDKLPIGFEKRKENIAIFNSSEDEFKSIKEWNHNLFSSQNEIVINLCKHFLSDKSIQFYLRFHPNLSGIANSQIQELEKYRFKNLHIIYPESDISTYTLMKKCNKVLSFGSRTSIESAYHGTPSIIYGKSFYNKLPSLYNPKDFHELVKVLGTKKLKNKSGEDLLKAALFLQERGNKLEYINVVSKNTVYFKGNKMKVSIYSLIKSFLELINDFTLWKICFKELNKKNLNFSDLKKL